jgi:hypothetical protein
MSDGFTVDPENLSRHAGSVDGYAGHLRKVAAAARPIGLDAYGVVGRAFAGSAVDAATRGSGALGELAIAAAAYRADLQACLSDYLLVDREVADALRAVP